MLDFFDQLKSRTKGYASLDYDIIGNAAVGPGEAGHPLARRARSTPFQVVHKDKAYYAGRSLRAPASEQIPRQKFEVGIQAAIGGQGHRRESVKPIRKDVIAKCYGGDITRKRKLLEKQKAGKKRMKQVGRIEVPERRSWPCWSSGSSWCSRLGSSNSRSPDALPDGWERPAGGV